MFYFSLDGEASLASHPAAKPKRFVCDAYQHRLRFLPASFAIPTSIVCDPTSVFL
jgi:hypothetical protein